MTSIEELEARVSALESAVVTYRQDAAAARVLAGSADRDVSAFAAKLDAQKKLLEALRETQVEQGQRLSGVEGRLIGVEGRLDRLEQKVDAGFASTAVGMAEIVALLTRRLDEPDG